jgi:hypothetical protein
MKMEELLNEFGEDLMYCCKCGKESEEVDSNDICPACGGVDENECYENKGVGKMNEWNNFNTLQHVKGSIWITKHDPEVKGPKGLNICEYNQYLKDFRVLTYIIKNEKGYCSNPDGKYYDLMGIIESWLMAQFGTLNRLEDENV